MRSANASLSRNDKASTNTLKRRLRTNIECPVAIPYELLFPSVIAAWGIVSTAGSPATTRARNGAPHGNRHRPAPLRGPSRLWSILVPPGPSPSPPCPEGARARPAPGGTAPESHVGRPPNLLQSESAVNSDRQSPVRDAEVVASLHGGRTG